MNSVIVHLLTQIASASDSHATQTLTAISDLANCPRPTLDGILSDLGVHLAFPPSQTILVFDKTAFVLAANRPIAS